MSKATKNKRVNASKDIKFAVIETVQQDADVVVEFIPQIWFITEKKKTVTVRESAKCYYPRRMAKQTIDQYLKHLKHAKFECLKPNNDNNWEILQCKVLKVGIASFAEAVESEKFFSDFFNTTDAEAELRERVLPPKRLRKTKKPKVSTPCESESDDEDEKVSAKAVEIPDYNAAFKQVVTQEEVNLITVGGETDINQTSERPSDSDDIFRISAEQLPNLNIDLNNVSEFVDGQLIY